MPTSREVATKPGSEKSARIDMGFLERLSTGRLDLLETTVASLVELLGAVVVPPWRTKTQVDEGDDEPAAAICHAIRAAAPPDARLLIAESVIRPGNEPEGAKWLDLLMLVLAGGRERSAAQWRDLLGSTGFDIEQIESGLIQARCR